MRGNCAALTTAPPIREKNGGAVPRAVLSLFSGLRRKQSAQFGAVGAVAPMPTIDRSATHPRAGFSNAILNIDTPLALRREYRVIGRLCTRETHTREGPASV